MTNTANAARLHRITEGVVASYIHDLAESGLRPDLWEPPGIPGISELEPRLRKASLHVPRPRLAVLAAVHAHPHADTESIVGFARADLGGVSRQVVYDVLRALTDAGRPHPATESCGHPCPSTARRGRLAVRATEEWPCRSISIVQPRPIR